MAQFNIENSHVEQMTDSGDNYKSVAVSTEKTLWDHFCSWYGILGTTVTVLAFWAFGCQIWHWWFFGIKI